MGADGGHIGPVAGGPAIGGHVGVDKVKSIPGGIGAVQAKLGGDDALGAGRTVNAARHGGGKLIPLENDLIDRVGETGTGHPVEHRSQRR